MVAEVKVFQKQPPTIITDPVTEDVVGVVRLFALGIKKTDRPVSYKEVEEMIFDVVIPAFVDASDRKEYIQDLVDSRGWTYTVTSAWMPETNEPF